MKFIIVAIAAFAVFTTETSQATSIKRYKDLVSCSGQFENPSGPVVGYGVDVVLDYATGNKLLRVQPVCPACRGVAGDSQSRFMPTYIPITQERMAGMVRLYAGNRVSLQITMESYAPTNTHPARFHMKTESGSFRMPMTCVDMTPIYMR